MAIYALCPFYESEKNNVLFCEGTNVHFPSREYRGMWMEMHCFSRKYKICKFYIELMKSMTQKIDKPAPFMIKFNLKTEPDMWNPAKLHFLLTLVRSESL